MNVRRTYVYERTFFRYVCTFMNVQTYVLILLRFACHTHAQYVERTFLILKVTKSEKCTSDKKSPPVIPFYERVWLRQTIM